MVHDELDALALGVVTELSHIEVGVGSEEVEYELLELAEPVFPALVPALDEDSLDVVGGCEIYVLLDVLGIGGMGAVGNGLGVVGDAELYVGLVGVAPCTASGGEHLPPYSCEFLGPDPVGVLYGAGLVEVEDQAALEDGGSVVGDDDGSPGCGLGCLDVASVAEGVRYEVGDELGAALTGVLYLELHGGEVDQGGLMDVDVQPAAVALEHHRGLHSGHGHGADAGVAAAVEVRVEDGNPAHGRGLVDEFVGVVVTGNPEGGEVLVEGKLRQLVADNEVAEGLLLGKLVAEAEPVVEEAEADDNHAVSVCLCAECSAHGLAEVDGQFVVVVADVALLAPDSLPGVVYGCAGGAVEDEAL